MAKKRKNPFDNLVSNPKGSAPGNVDIKSALHGIDIFDLLPLVNEMSEEEGMITFAMISHLYKSGITPERYAAFYKVCQRLSPLLAEDKEDEEQFEKKGAESEKFAGSGKSLRIRIQMKGVKKPPMWREVEMPSDASFLTLHQVIQIVAGLDNYHLWQFNEKAYDEEIQIGIPMDDEYGGGIEDVTDDARTTPISVYLAKEGDKLEYVYDFGGDWIFELSVKKVLDKRLNNPVCVAFKGDMNPEEDSGGIWSYLDMRTYYAEWNSYTKKKRKEIAENMCYDSADEYYENLKDHLFDIDEVNDALEGL